MFFVRGWFRLLLVQQRRLLTTLRPEDVTQILRKDEFIVAKQTLPSFLKSIECNQLGSNNPIEDRIRVSSLQIPGHKEPTILVGVFDGHGGVTTADLVSRRLFNYISISLYPERLDIVDLFHSPPPKHDPALRPDELEALSLFKDEIINTNSINNSNNDNSQITSNKTSENNNYENNNNNNNNNILQNLKASFKRCDEDLSREIQRELTSTLPSHAALHYYLSAAISGCCAIVMILQEDRSYVASVGDCRIVFGSYHDQIRGSSSKTTQSHVNNLNVHAEDLVDEHNCYNRSETRRLVASHPISEQNSLVRQNRLLGHLMPFRAFGDFNYKWPAHLIHKCGLTRTYGNSIIPSHYETPPYLISEPDVKELDMRLLLRESTGKDEDKVNSNKCIVLATDGLWELFESSRDVIESVANHSILVNNNQEKQSVSIVSENHDSNSATHVLRSALCYGSQPQDCTMDHEELNRMQHSRLEAMLTLPKSIARNFRDDISMIIMKFNKRD